MNNIFHIWFGNGNYTPQVVTVNAMNIDDAIILAKAERIKISADHTVCEVMTYAAAKQMKQIIHVLINGMPKCGFTNDTPNHWPPNHIWTNGADCSECLNTT